MKKTILAIALAAMSGSACAEMVDGGQITIGGLVSQNTCVPHVNGGAQDAEIMLQTATVEEVKATNGVKDLEVGAKPKNFSITLDCSKASSLTKTDVVMRMDSTFFGNSQGTLSNDQSILEPAYNTGIAIHNLNTSGSSNEYKQVKINNPTSTIPNGKLPAGDRTYTWQFTASYVTLVANQDPKPGHVKTNASYTFEYK